MNTAIIQLHKCCRKVLHDETFHGLLQPKHFHKHRSVFTVTHFEE